MLSEVMLWNNTLRCCMSKDPYGYWEWKRETTVCFLFWSSGGWSIFSSFCGSTNSICCLISAGLTIMHHVSLAILLDSWCLLNVPADRRVRVFLSFSEYWEEKGCGISGCASSHYRNSWDPACRDQISPGPQLDIWNFSVHLSHSALLL